MENISAEYELWIVDADTKNSWFHYLNYISRFQITKYFKRISTEPSIILHMSVNDFPTRHVLFVDTSKDVSSHQIRTKWEDLGKPKTLVFPSTSRIFSDIVSMDREKFRLLQ